MHWTSQYTTPPPPQLPALTLAPASPSRLGTSLYRNPLLVRSGGIIGEIFKIVHFGTPPTSADIWWQLKHIRSAQAGSMHLTGMLSFSCPHLSVILSTGGRQFCLWIQGVCHWVGGCLALGPGGGLPLGPGRFLHLGPGGVCLWVWGCVCRGVYTPAGRHPPPTLDRHPPGRPPSPRQAAYWNAFL